MDIYYLGQSSFRLKGKNASLITDPFSPVFLGLKFPKVEADIVTLSHSHQDHNYFQGVSGDPFVVSEAGEYEVKGISIFGYLTSHGTNEGVDLGENIVYLFDIDGVRVCHLGDLGANLPAKVLEQISGVDVLMVPVGGKYTLGSKEAVDIIGQIEPLIVVPMHYKMNGTKTNDLLEVDKFLAQMGTKEPEKLDKLSLTKDKLPQEMKVVVLEKKE